MNFVPVDDQIVNIRQIVRKCPPVTLRRAYMRAAREWCQQTQWLRETLPGETEADTKTYTFGTDPDLDIIAILSMQLTDSAGNVWPLGASDPLTWNPNLKPDTPRRYGYSPEGGFMLDPTPDKAYVLSTVLALTPKETTANVPASIVVKYSNDIEAGALAYLHAIPGEPWYNLQVAQLRAKEFQSGIANGKTDAQRAYNTGSMRVRPRGFLRGPAPGGMW